VVCGLRDGVSRGELCAFFLRLVLGFAHQQLVLGFWFLVSGFTLPAAPVASTFLV
jgi:hypothetical protein